MAKKRKNRNKPKPLLAVAGIVHLSDSFVPPTQESGLLNTVGGDEDCQGLVLAPNYGYGIAASSLEQNKSEEKETGSPANDESEKENDKGTQNDLEGKETDQPNSPTHSPAQNQKEKEKEVDTDELSVALLVRHIGGAKAKPLVRGDVVEDRPLEDQPKEVLEKDDAETSEFYASLGIARPNQTADVPKDIDETSPPENLEKSEEVAVIPESVPESKTDSIEPTTESIAEYYKSYTKYYYSYQPDPYGTEPLEFGQPTVSEDVLADPNTDRSIIDMARRAQRAKRAYEAKKREEAAKKKAEEKKAVEEGGPDGYDPLPMEIIPSTVVEDLNITPDTTLTEYWSYIQDSPHDFHRWTYLISYVESTLTLAECRKVYSAFLPIFPYCFGYWKRYSQIEKAHNYFQRALTVLQKGLEFVPLSVDLWIAYLNLYAEINVHNEDFKTQMREQYELALSIVGLEFRSDMIWEAYIQWEIDQKDLKRAVQIYRRVLQVPTRLYNRHWDNFQALVRDHHPRNFLMYDEYERRRKAGCKALKFRYHPEPEVETGEVRKTTKPEDSLMDFVKERVLEKATALHTKTEEEVDKRWDFEEKIKRPYFHVKALDKRQLANWDEYLNFEIEAGDHERIVILFERCVITCAQYENYWCKYARYIENYYRKQPSLGSTVSAHILRSMLDREIGSKKQTEEEEALIASITSVMNSMLSQIEEKEELEISIVKDILESIVMKLDSESDISSSSVKSPIPVDMEAELGTVRESSDDDITDVTPVNLGGHSGTEPTELPRKTGEHIDIEPTSVGLTSLISTPTFPKSSVYWHEPVRDIYRRACVVHCPKRPAIRLQWAAFEEEIGNLKEARQLIEHVLEWFPTHWTAKCQLLELERRAGNYDRVQELFDAYLKTKSKEEYGVLAMKYARFIYKECGKPDQALSILRSAIKKDKSNHRLYSYVIEICYERFPADRRGAFAAMELALQSKDISDEHKLLFCKRKVVYLQEHGDLKSYRNAIDELNDYEAKARKKEAESLKWKEFERRLEIQKHIEETGNLQPFPVPSWKSVSTKQPQQPLPIKFETNGDDSNDITIATDDVVEHTVVDPAAPYKYVPPVDEAILSSNYGYGPKHPESKIIEKIGHQQYQAIEAKGYDESLKDTPEALKELRKRKNPLYIVAPRGSYRVNQDQDGPSDMKRPRLQAPVLLSDLITPNSAPCVNVPDWFVKEGGELCLSETNRGFSMLRYWPHFLSEEGNKKMFKVLRKSVKWHQKQIQTQTGKWRYVPRLVSWLGPCDYTYTGMKLEKCEDWPPEILDLIHRLIQLTHFEFNSCSLNLYRTGHDSNGWHADIHPGLGSNPAIASISLGSLRSFEMKRKYPGNNFIRFPLFPGSLLIMEGATQQDWVHSIPKEPTVKEERMNLTFRVMHSLEDPDSINPDTPKEPDNKMDCSAPTSLTPPDMLKDSKP